MTDQTGKEKSGERECIGDFAVSLFKFWMKISLLAISLFILIVWQSKNKISIQKRYPKQDKICITL